MLILIYVVCLIFIDENEGKIAIAHGIEAIVTAMRTHASNAILQANGCGALWHVVFTNGNIIKILFFSSSNLC